MEERGRRLWRTREGPVVCLQREKRKRENEARNVAFPTRGTSIGWCSSISRFVVPDISFPYGSLNTRREGDGVDFVDVCFRQKSLHDMMSSWREKEREREIRLYFMVICAREYGYGSWYFEGFSFSLCKVFRLFHFRFSMYSSYILYNLMLFAFENTFRLKILKLSFKRRLNFFQQLVENLFFI